MPNWKREGESVICKTAPNDLTLVTPHVFECVLRDKEWRQADAAQRWEISERHFRRIKSEPLHRAYYADAVYGLPKFRRNLVKPPRMPVDDFISLIYKKGWNRSEVAERWGYARSTLSNILRKAALPANESGLESDSIWVPIPGCLIDAVLGMPEKQKVNHE